MANSTNHETVGEFPSSLLPYEEKIKNSFGLQYARAMYGKFTSGRLQGRKKWRERIIKLRLLREGSTNMSEYIDQEMQQEGESYANVDFTPIPVIPKFVDVIVNRIVKNDFFPEVEASDVEAVGEKTMHEQLAIAQIGARKMQEAMMAMAGVSPDMLPEPKFKTPQDVEVHMLTDFKLSTEIGLEKGLEFIVQKDRFKTLRRGVAEDLATIGIAAAKTEYNPITGQLSNRLVDMENAIYPLSTRDDFSKIPYFGEIRMVTIGEIRGHTNWTIEVYKNIASTYTGRHGNPDSISIGGGAMSSYSDAIYDEFLIPILDFECLSECSIVREKKMTKGGFYRFDRREEGHEIPENSVMERELKKTTRQAIFGGCWIVGSEYIYNYGEKTSVFRKNTDLFDTALNYTVYATNWYRNDNISLVERIEGYAKQMVNAHIKTQLLVGKARPNGIVLDIAGLKEIDLDGTESYASPMELVRVYDQTGNLIWNSEDDSGEPLRGSPPFMELTNGVSWQGLKALMDVYNFNLQMMRDVTGFNEVIDGSTPSAEMLVGVQQNAIESANNAIYQIDFGTNDVIERTLEKNMLGLFEGVRKNKQAYADVIGEGSVHALSMIASDMKREFNIFVRLAPTQEQRLYLEQNIQAAITNQQLSAYQANAIRRARTFKLAQVMLGVLTENYMAQVQAREKEKIEYKASLDQQTAIISNEEQRKTLAEKRETDLIILKAKHLSEKELKKDAHQYTLKEIQEKAKGDLSVAKAAVGQKQELQSYMEDRRDERQRQNKTMESKLIEQRDSSGKAVDFKTKAESSPKEISPTKVDTSGGDEGDFTKFVDSYIPDSETLGTPPQPEEPEGMVEDEMGNYNENEPVVEQEDLV